MTTSNKDNDKIIDIFNNNKLLNKGINYDSMNYINNWNLIMEVVEKIESIKIESYNVRVDIFLNSCFIAPCHWQELIKVYGKTKIEAVYDACLQFIKWYNENK